MLYKTSINYCIINNMIIITKMCVLIQHIPNKYMLLDILISDDHVLLFLKFLLIHNLSTLKVKLLFLKHNNITTQNVGQYKTFTILNINNLLLFNKISLSIMKV